MRLSLKAVTPLFGKTEENSELNVTPYFLRKSDTVPVATITLSEDPHGEPPTAPTGRYVLMLNGRTGKLQLLNADSAGHAEPGE